MKHVLLFALALTLAACSPIGHSDDVDELILMNRSGETVWFVALELELSHRVDPLPAFNPQRVTLPMLRAGEAALLADIPEYEAGRAVRIFVYAMRPDTDEGLPQRAVLAKYVTATAQELRRNRGLVVVEEL